MIDSTFYSIPTYNDRVKFFISVCFGMLSLLFSNFGLSATFDKVVVNVPWSLVFPMLVALAYGPKFGIIAGLAGGALHPFLLWANNGWQNILNLFILLGYYSCIGFASDAHKNYLTKRVTSLILRIILVLIPFLLIMSIAYKFVIPFSMKFNPAFWAPDSVKNMDPNLITIFSVKDSINFTLISISSSALLHLPVIRILLGLKTPPKMRENSKVFASSIITALLIWLSYAAFDFFLIDTNKNIFADTHIRLALFLFISSGILAASVLSSYIERRLEAEDSFRESDELQRKLISTIPDIIIRTDLQGNIVFVNETVFLSWSYKPGENIVGKNMIEFISPDYREKAIKLTQMMLEKPLGPQEYKLIFDDGYELDCEINGDVLRGGNNKPYGMVYIIRDITDRKKAAIELSKSSEKFKNYIDFSPEGVFVCDELGNYIEVNSAASRLTGYSKEELLNINLIQIIFPNHQELAFQHFQRLVAEGSAVEDFKYVTKLGDIRWWTVSAVKLSATRFLGFAHDITKRKILEEDLIAAREKAEEMSRLKSSFLANMSHELRTPLIGILGFSEILSESLKDDENKHKINVINKSGNRLLFTLNSILDLSRIESNKLSINWEELNVYDVVKEIVQTFSASAISKGLAISLEYSSKNIMSLLDRKMFESIITNLVSNAITYTEEGNIVIDINEHFKSGKPTFSISIKDTGIGIEKEKFELIFDAFRQASEGYGRSHEGTGLGLTITKRFTEFLNGKVFLESEMGVGSTFTVEFFRAESNISTAISSHAMPEANISLTNNLKTIKACILLIDDDEIMFDVTSKMIGAKIDYAQSATKALELLLVNQYSLILLDINLGRGKNGIELLQDIRSLKSYTTTPVLAITAYAMDSDRENFLSAGCNGYISKPFTKHTLREALSKFIEV